MDPRLGSLGFGIEQESDLVRLVERAIQEGEVADSARGRYTTWDAGAGIEIWVHANPGGEVTGLSPHLVGAGLVRVNIARTFWRPDHPLKGRLFGWADPQGGDIEPGKYPLVLEIPNFDLVRERLSVAATVSLQVAAFADELHCYPDDEAFTQALEAGVRLAPEDFVSAGLSGFDEEEATPPEPSAVFTGHVQAAELRSNPVTGRPFHYLRVHTEGGVIDVVANPGQVNGEPVVGGVVHGGFWLSARPVEPEREAYEAWGI